MHHSAVLSLVKFNTTTAIIMSTTEQELTDTTLLDQRRLGNLIKEAQECSQNSELVLSAYDIEIRLEMLDLHWKQFAQNDLYLQRRSDALKGRSYFTSNIYNVAQDFYFKAKAQYRKLLDDARPTVQTVQAPSGTGGATIITNSSNQSELEALKLPTFSGLQRDWEPFKDRFTLMVIENKQAKPDIKFQRLTNSLSGDALALIQGIRPTGENFNLAWKTLSRRYDNPQLKFSTQMDLLLKMPEIGRAHV